MSANNELQILLEERISGTQVSAKVFLGSNLRGLRLAGTLSIPLDVYPALTRALATTGNLRRGPCQFGCGHASHLEEVCLAALLSDGHESLCPCRGSLDTDG